MDMRRGKYASSAGLTSTVRLPAYRPRELLLGCRDLPVLDPAEQRSRPLHPVGVGQFLEVRNTRYRADEEALQPLDGLGNVRGGVVGDGSEQNRAGVERRLGLLRVLLAALPRRLRVEEAVGAPAHRQQLRERFARPDREHPLLVARFQLLKVREGFAGVFGVFRRTAKFAIEVALGEGE